MEFINPTNQYRPATQQNTVNEVRLPKTDGVSHNHNAQKIHELREELSQIQAQLSDVQNQSCDIYLARSDRRITQDGFKPVDFTSEEKKELAQLEELEGEIKTIYSAKCDELEQYYFHECNHGNEDQQKKAFEELGLSLLTDRFRWRQHASQQDYSLKKSGDWKKNLLPEHAAQHGEICAELAREHLDENTKISDEFHQASTICRYEIASQCGNTDATNALLKIYKENQFLLPTEDRDKSARSDKTFQLARRAAEQGSAVWLDLGEFYERENDITSAEICYTSAVIEDMSIKACLKLAQLIFNTNETDPRIKYYIAKVMSSNDSGTRKELVEWQNSIQGNHCSIQ